MADDFSKNIKSAKLYQDALDAVDKRMKAQEKSVQSLADITGVAFSGFITQIEKTNEQRREELKLMKDAEKTVQEQSKSIGKLIDKTYGISTALESTINKSEIFSKSLENLSLSDLSKQFDGIESVEKRLSKLTQENSKESLKNLAEFKELKGLKDEYDKNQKVAASLNKKNLEKFLDDNTEIVGLLGEMPVNLNDAVEVQKVLNSMMNGEKEIVDQIITSNSGSIDIKKELIDLDDRRIDSQENLNRISKEYSNEMTNQTGLLNNLINMVSKNSQNAMTGIIRKMGEYDQAISDAGKNFGFVNAKSLETSVNMASLGQSAARFNVSLGDAVNMMGDLGDELASIDQDYLANSVEHFMAIEKATGISSKEIATIAGEMMRAGKSAEEVEGFMDSSNQISKQFGVNTKKVLQGVSRNIDKMRQMGFQGGEESLVKMVATAERLRMNVDEIFDVAKKARTIEGAMDMAAELQLAGGSFAAINPMDLLSAARKGPKELQNILTSMGGDIGTWNEEMGTLQFDAVDVDRLKMVADATGQSLDSIQKMIQKNAEDNKKTDILGLSTSLGDEERNFLTDMTKMEGGQIQMDDELKDLATSAGIEIANVDDLQNLSQEDMQKLMEEKAMRGKTLEEQAEANQSFQDSISAFKDAIMNLFTVFEPVISVLTSFVQTLNGMPGPFKALAAALVGLVAFGPKLISAFGQFKEGTTAIGKSFKGLMGGKGIKGKVKGVLGGGETGKITEGVTDKTPKGGEGGLKNLAEGLKAMGGKGVLKGIANTALAGPALLLMLPGMPTVFLMAAVGALGKLVEFGFRSLANGISAMGNAKGVLKGALAMVIIGASLIPFALALQMMSEVEWGTIGMMVVGIIALAGIVTLLGFIAPLMLMGALALAAASVGLLIFATAITSFAEASKLMQGMEFGWLGDLGWNLLIASPGLLLGGLALAVASPFLAMGSIGLMAIAVAAQTVSNVDWSSFAAMGDALLGIVPGLLGFGFAGLMFLNPLLLLGMLLMIGNLGMLATVMAPLAAFLETGADGLDRFADGLTKLQAAANNLDFDRLESLKDLSIGMASAGSGGGMGDELGKIAEALAKLSGGASGGGKGKGTVRVEVDLKMNGRMMQEIIIEDTEIVS